MTKLTRSLLRTWLICVAVAACAMPLLGQSAPSLLRLSSTTTSLTERVRWTAITYQVPIPYQVTWTRNHQPLAVDTTTALVDTITFTRAGRGIPDSLTACVAALYQSASYGSRCATWVYTNGAAPVPIPIPVTLVSVAIIPNADTILIGGTRQFTATVTWSTGVTAVLIPQWGAAGGSIDAGGVYTAGTTPGRYPVTASAQTKTDTAWVIVQPLPPAPVPLRAVIVKPVVCVGLDCELDGRGSTGSIVRYEWRSVCPACTGAVQFTGPLWPYTAPVATTRSRSLTVTSASGATAVDTVTFTPTAPPGPIPPPVSVTSLAVSTSRVALGPSDTVETVVTFTPPSGTTDSTVVLVSRLDAWGSIPILASGGSVMVRHPIGRNLVVSNLWVDLLVVVCRYATSGVACVEHVGPPVQVVP